MRKLVLKASAGTGKTYRLSLEYVLALLNGRDFKSILVMTFTRKATAEIKKEVLTKIKNFLEIYELTKENKDNLINSIKATDIEQKKKENLINLITSINKLGEFDLSNEQLKKIPEIYADILKNKEKMKIYTIDAFLNLIFKNITINYLGIKNFSLVDEEENKIYYKKVLENIWTKKELFSKFLSFFNENSEKNIDSYIELIENLVNNRWKYLISDYYEKNIFCKEKLEINKNSAKIFLEIFDYIENECNKNLAESIKKEYLKYVDKDFNQISQILIEDYKNIFDKNIYNGNKFKKKTDVDYKEDLDKLYEELKLNLGKEIYNNILIPYEEDILELSKSIYNFYDELKIKEKKFTFNDIAIYTYMTMFDKNNLLLGENGLNKNFYNEIDMSIESVFIDEFQDTSILQWKILFEIIKNAEDVICVGDEKQSIYGWRGGEKKLFENLEKVLELGFSHKIKTENMKVSYRSDINIVEHTNSIFNNISNENNFNWKFEPSEPNSKNSGYVNFLKIEKSKDEERDIIQTLVEEIEKLNTTNFSDFAIIARTNKDLKEIAKKLEDKKIPYNLTQKSDIYKTNGIFEYLEFLKYLIYDNELAIFNFIASDLSNFGTKILETFLKNKKSLIDYLNGNNENLLNIYPEKVETFLKKIKSLKIEYKILSPQDLTFRIFDDFNFTKIYKKEIELKNIFEAYLISKKYQNILDLFQDYENFEINFSDLNTNKNAIELITIHKSKGLQYKTVFVLDKKIKSKFREIDFIFSMNNTYTEVNYSLFLKKGYKNVLDVCFPEIIKKYNEAQMEEEINNQYVALTRAKNNLIVITENFENTILGTFIQENKDDKKIENERFFSLAEHKKIKSPAFVSEINKAKFSLQTEEKRMLGLLIHYFLENIKYGEEQEIIYAIKLCEKKYGTYFGKEKLKKIFSKSNINNILNKSTEIFSKNWNYIYSEYELFDTEAKKAYRIDRLMIDTNNKQILIVDYKTGTFNQEQLENYKRLLKNNFLLELENYDIKTQFLEFNIDY